VSRLASVSKPSKATLVSEATQKLGEGVLLLAGKVVRLKPYRSSFSLNCRGAR
jgi:hypothetical protein